MSEAEHVCRCPQRSLLGVSCARLRVLWSLQTQHVFKHFMVVNSGLMGAQSIPHTKYAKQLKDGALSVSQLFIWNNRLCFSWTLCFASLELAFCQPPKPKSELIQTLGRMDLAPSPVFQVHL